jgi:glutamyl-tRNA synthetase
MPKEGIASFEDIVYGHIEVENATLDDQILLKSDGLPTYNFANVVDDHLMGITHVIRGSEYLSSTPKYNLLYESFGWDLPEYIHCLPVMKDATQKLSKRNGDASFGDLIAKGYLKEAVLNYIALLGWSPGGEEEKFDLKGLVEAFDVKGISKSPAIFDPKKLSWLNGEYLRAMSDEEFHEAALPYIRQAVKSDVDTAFIAALLKERCECLADIPGQLDFIDELPDYAPDLYENKKMKTDPENSKEALLAILPGLEGLDAWDKESIHAALFALIEKLGLKNGRILWPLRVALSGKPFTPGGGIEICVILGKEESISRVKKGLALLGA